MSPAPNKFPQSPKSASSANPQPEAEANSAPEPSSSAETMTDQHSDSMLATSSTSSPAAANTAAPETPPAIEPSPEVSDPVTDPVAEPPTPTAPAEASSPAAMVAKRPVRPEPAQPSEAAPTPASHQSAQPADPSSEALPKATEATTEGASSPEPAPVSNRSASPTADGASEADKPPSTSIRQQPIPPASEPMQYRAIGLVRGKYVASAEQFTRGSIHTDDGVTIDAVLLGRVMSLVKKHLDLEQSHLWVVYPRTREKELDLHVQIVGVWEPEKLNRLPSAEPTVETETDRAKSETSEAAEEAVETAEEATGESVTTSTPGDAAEPAAESTETDATADSLTTSDSANLAAVASSAELDDRYFSVRGEVVFQSPEDQRLLVKIRRTPRQGTDQTKAFKVALKGTLEGKALGYFWDLQVQREANELIVKEATQIGMVPPQKRGGKKPSRRGGPPRRGGSGPRKPWRNNRDGAPTPRVDRNRDRSPQSSAPRQPAAKPIKRRKTEPEQ